MVELIPRLLFQGNLSEHSPARAKSSLEGEGSSCLPEVCTNSCCCEFLDTAPASSEPGVCRGVSAKSQSGSEGEPGRVLMEGQLELLRRLQSKGIKGGSARGSF